MKRHWIDMVELLANMRGPEHFWRHHTHWIVCLQNGWGSCQSKRHDRTFQQHGSENYWKLKVSLIEALALKRGFVLESNGLRQYEIVNYVLAQTTSREAETDPDLQSPFSSTWCFCSNSRSKAWFAWDMFTSGIVFRVGHRWMQMYQGNLLVQCLQPSNCPKKKVISGGKIFESSKNLVSSKIAKCFFQKNFNPSASSTGVRGYLRMGDGAVTGLAPWGRPGIHHCCTCFWCRKLVLKYLQLVFYRIGKTAQRFGVG